MTSLPQAGPMAQNWSEVVQGLGTMVHRPPTSPQVEGGAILTVVMVLGSVAVILGGLTWLVFWLASPSVEVDNHSNSEYNETGYCLIESYVDGPINFTAVVVVVRSIITHVASVLYCYTKYSRKPPMVQPMDLIAQAHLAPVASASCHAAKVNHQPSNCP